MEVVAAVGVAVGTGKDIRCERLDWSTRAVHNDYESRRTCQTNLYTGWRWDATENYLNKGKKTETAARRKYSIDSHTEPVKKQQTKTNVLFCPCGGRWWWS